MEAPCSNPAPGLRVSIAPVISLLLFVAVFAGFQGGRYFMANRLQELGILSSLLVFALGAWLGLFRMPQREWKRWVYTPVLLAGGIMLVWSAVFALRFNESLVYCLFASREFLLMFTGPAMVLILRSGYPREYLERTLWFSFLCLMLCYLYFYFTLDLRESFFSSDHTVSNLVTYDEWRGFRLKPPLFAIMLGLLASLVLLFRAGSSPAQRLFALLLLGLACGIWSIVQFRSTLATMLLSMLLFPILLARPNRVVLMLLAIPLALLLLPHVLGLALEHFLGADGGDIRMKAYQVALGNIPRHLLLGVGEDNSYGRTYQDLFGFYFYPSDLGFIGIIFKYGLLGAVLYLGMHMLIWYRLLRTHWHVRAEEGRVHPLLWALLIFFTAQTFNLVLNPGLAYAQGITTGSIALALCAILRSPQRVEPAI